MTLFSNQPGDEGLPGHERARVMVALMTTTLMGVFDGTMINVALPSMASAMQVSANVAVWFANGYLLSAAMTLAIFAALAARMGYRPVFLAGLATFTLTSLGCALATTPDMLIGMRVLQGIGGAATLSIAPAILRSVFPGRLLGRVLGLHALLIAASTAIAPVLGGTILEALRWEWLFAINIIPGSVALLLAWKALPRGSASSKTPFDTAGAVLSAILLGSTIMTANSFQHVSHEAVFWAGIALLSATAFIWHIRRVQSPLLPPRYLPQRPLYARRTHLTCVVCQPGHHLYRAAVYVSERVWLQPAGIGPSVHPLADWHRVDCPSRGPLGRYDFRAADFHHRADDFCRWVDPAGDVTRKPSHMGYLPAQSGMRYWVWLLPEP